MTKTIERIIELLNEVSITPSKMALDLGFSSGLFSQWKSGLQKPSLEKLNKIADYLNCDIDYLLCKSDVKKSLPSQIDSKLINIYNELSDEGRAKLIAHAELLLKAKE